LFDIQFISDEVETQEDGWQGLRGAIILGNEREEFMASLSSWSRQQYETHWLEAAARLLGPEGRAGFFTWAFHYWWVMWRFGPNVYAQEHAFSAATLARITDRSRAPYELVRDHSIRDGERGVSEWAFAAADVEDFLKRSAGGGVAI
jgi:hypothetical protein